MQTRLKNYSVLFCAFLLSACGSDSEPVDITANEPDMAPEQTTQVEDTCAADGELSYICGLQNAEDILALGDTGMLLASGMSRGDISAHMYLVDPVRKESRALIYGGGFSIELDNAMFPSCPSVINLRNYSVHGISLREYEADKFDVYVTSHGAREAIEVFDLDMSGDRPAVAWKGCVPFPDDISINSVAILGDGGFLTTQFLDQRGMAAVSEGEINGLVFEWHPGGDITPVEGTELSGANGITLSEDERFMYVAAFGGREVAKFDRSMSPMSKQVVSLDIAPDNIRWGTNGMLLTAGNNVSGDGWAVVEIDPEAMTAERIGSFDGSVALQGASSALQVGDEIWVGSYNSDRLAYFPR